MACHHLHARGLPDEATCRLDAGLLQIANQRLDADTADLLVVRERQMQRLVQRCGQEFRQRRQAGSDKTLHVDRTAPIDAAAGQMRDEGIGIPRLAVDRHHVGMPAQHDARPARLSDSGEKVRLASLGVIRKARVDTERPQMIPQELDHAKVGLAAGGVKANQCLEQLDGVVQCLDLWHENLWADCRRACDRETLPHILAA